MKRVFTLVLAIIMLALLISCGDEVATSPASTAQPAITTTPLATTPSGVSPTTVSPATGTPAPAETAVNNDVMIASAMAGLFYDLNAIQKYYDDSLTAMSSFDVGTGTAIAGRQGNIVLLAGHTSATVEGQSNIPPEYMDKLPPDGRIAAPPGACPAAAEPGVTFITEDGEPVTPGLLADKDIQSIPTEWLTIAQDDPGSLFSIINNMVPQYDPGLADPEGWNTLLWDQLKELQEPAESLMDYQMWNAAGDIEQQIIEAYRQQLVARGLPQQVIDAFDASGKTGWFSSLPPTEADALARMDIIAEMTGSVSGTVHEWRDFSIPGMGQPPEFGPQRGDGTVSWEHPEIGKVDFSVDILLDRFDEQGRAIGGTVTAKSINQEGYEVVFTFKPDGSKDGVVFKDGEEVGQLTMSVNQEKFENYIDIKEGTEIKMPDNGRTHFQ